MARIDYPTLDSPEAQHLADEIRKERGGRLLNLYNIQLYNPAIADGWLRLGTAVRFKSQLDSPTRELAICLVSRLTRAEYEWQAHRRLAIETGFPEAQVESVLDWRSGSFGDKHRAVLALTEELTTNVEASDATFDQVRAHLSPREIMELVATVAYYNMVARFLVGLKIDLEK